MRKICLITFGCQMNKLDSELAAEALAEAGHQIVDDEGMADTVIFNTCSVRDHAEQRVLSRLAQLKPRRDREPGFRLGLMGCFAERDGQDLLARLPYLDFAVGTRQFMRLPDLIRTLDETDNWRDGWFGGSETMEPGLDQAHERSRHHGIQGFVSVMRGCDNRCSYCIVPDVRGGEVSRPEAEVVKEVAALVSRGAREVTLLGQNIDAYGKHIGASLARLLRRIDREIPERDGLRRIRFVTSHPRDINEELVTAVAEIPRVCEHFHMPAQSGSDRILQAMRRGYDRSTYDGKVAMIRRIIPHAMIASDFIVGFPGETEDDFQATVDLVRTSRFQNSFIFKYSPRPGTVSALAMADDIPDTVKKRRNNELLAEQAAVNVQRGQELVGSRQTVLVEGVSSRDAARWTGRTAGNLICVFPAPETGHVSAGALLELEVESASQLTLYCRRV